MNKHPSGRPIKIGKKTERTIWRVPDYGFVTPRLRDPVPANRIGFTTNFLPGQQKLEDDDEQK